MTTMREKFTVAAQRTVAKFSEGLYTYQDVSGESYNTDTGKVARPTVDTIIPAAVYAVSAEKQAMMTYSEKTCIVAIAGLDLGAVIPAVGGLIVFPVGTKHRIVHIETDQYGAAFFLHVTVTPIGA